MATYYKQDCPLCGMPAHYCFVDHHNRKFFDCPKCTKFQISKRAEEMLAEKEQSRRDTYASQAPNAPDNHHFLIRMPSHEFRQQSKDDLEASFVFKDELPLKCQ